MLVRLKRTRDGVVLSCLRGGSVAVQRTGHGGFFAFHDLMHYAVETTLGFREAFLGLVAAGWPLEAFSDKSDPRYAAMPAEAVLAEHVVASITRHLRDAVGEADELMPLWAEGVNADLAQSLAGAGHSPFRVEPAQLARIAALYRDLTDRWVRVPVGEHMELEFPGPLRSARRAAR